MSVEYYRIYNPLVASINPLMVIDGVIFTNLQLGRIYEKNPYTCDRVNEMVMGSEPSADRDVFHVLTEG